MRTGSGSIYSSAKRSMPAAQNLARNTIGRASNTEVRVSTILPHPEVNSRCACCTPFQTVVISSASCAPRHIGISKLNRTIRDACGQILSLSLLLVLSAVFSALISAISAPLRWIRMPVWLRRRQLSTGFRYSISGPQVPECQRPQADAHRVPHRVHLRPRLPAVVRRAPPPGPRRAAAADKLDQQLHFEFVAAAAQMHAAQPLQTDQPEPALAVADLPADRKSVVEGKR